MRTVTLLIIIIWLLLVTVSRASADDNKCALVKTAFSAASQIRGLREKRAVPCRLMSKGEVEKYLRKTLTKKIPEARLKNEERLYKLLGFIPKDYDYVNGLVKLYTEQIGGFYDPEAKYYAMADWMPMLLQMPIAVHELTHALQDQYYNLEKMMDDETGPTDELLARSALVEGDATAVMLDYTRELAGQESIAKETNVSSFVVQNIAGAMFSPSLHTAPAALQALLIFPYISGLNFVHTLLRGRGYHGVDVAFQKLPTSTEEILHPEKYRGSKDYEEISEVPPPEGVTLKSTQPVYHDRLGEFAISVLLGTWLPPERSSKIAAGWGGDKAALFDSSVTPFGTAVWKTSWDSTSEASEFFKGAIEAYTKRFGSAAPAQQLAQAKFSTPDFGQVSITIEKKSVTIEIGSPNHQ